MKKIYSLIVAAFVCTQPLAAQFQMQQKWHEPTASTENNIHITGNRMFDSTAALPKNTGAGQTWDFSSMVMSTVSAVTHTYTNASTAPNATMFPTATLAENMGGNNYMYYKSDTVGKQFEVVGISTPTLTAGFTNTKILYKWPISYQTTYNDTYSASQGTVATYSGSHTVTATGIGTLTLPGGKKFNNALQLRQMDSSTLTTTGSNASTVQTHTTRYMYYYDQLRYPLLVINYVTTVTDTSISSAEIMVNYLEAVGLNDHALAGKLKIYPNPASAHLQVDLENSSNAEGTITFYSANGMVLKTEALGGPGHIRKQIDLSLLPVGLYFIETKLGESRAVNKLIKQ